MNLTHSPAQVTQHLLDDLSIGTLPASDGDWPVYRWFLPPAPDNSILITDQVGKSADRGQATGTVFEFWGLQVLLRTNDGTAGWDKITDARQTLAEDVYDRNVRVTEDVGTASTLYIIQSFSNITPVNTLARRPDVSNLIVFTFNCLVNIREV